jgi:FkbM family methyltransferase
MPGSGSETLRGNQRVDVRRDQSLGPRHQLAKTLSATVKTILRTASRRLGFDLVRWHPQSSADAALGKMLAAQQIDTLLDVGANEGQYATMLRRLGFVGRIISFEPLTAAHQRLRHCAADDQMWIVAPRMAIGDQEREIRIHVASNGGASSSILNMLEPHIQAAPDVSYVGSELVPVRRLDTVAREFLTAGNVFLKVDVQGYEHYVLEGAAGLIANLRGIQLELSLVPLYQGQLLFPELLAFVISKGFSLWGLVPGLADKSSGRLLQADAIFFRP